MGSHPTSFASDHADRLTRRKRPRDVKARVADRLRSGEQPLHEMVASLSSRLLDLPPASVGNGIDDALRQVGESLQADCVTLYLRSADATSYAEIARHSQAAGEGVRACDPDSLASEPDVETFPLADYPYLAGQLTKAETVLLRGIEDLPGKQRSSEISFATHAWLLCFLHRWSPTEP